MAISLTTREASSISQIIYRINLSDNFNDLSRMFLSQIKTLIPFHKGMALEVETKDNKLVYSNPYYMGPSDEYFDESKFIEGNYRSVWWDYINAPWSSIFRNSDIVDEKEWISSPLYKDIYEPQKMYYALQATFVHNDIKLGMFGLNRTKEEGDFTDKELFIMELIKSHIELKLYRFLTRYNGFKVNPTAPGFFVPKAIIEDLKITRREEEIINMILNGADSDVLIENLCITRSTLDKHIHNIYQKVGVNNRAALIQKFRLPGIS